MNDAAVQLQPAPYVTIRLAAILTGYTEKAIRRKIEDGVWIENREWRRAPDGTILISIKGFQQWAETAAASASARRRSNSASLSTDASSATP